MHGQFDMVVNENNMKSSSDDASEPAEEPAPDSTVGESGIIPLNVILNFIIIVVYGEIYFDHE